MHVCLSAVEHVFSSRVLVSAHAALVCFRYTPSRAQSVTRQMMGRLFLGPCQVTRKFPPFFLKSSSTVAGSLLLSVSRLQLASLFFSFFLLFASRTRVPVPLSLPSSYPTPSTVDVQNMPVSCVHMPVCREVEKYKCARLWMFYLCVVLA